MAFQNAQYVEAHHAIMNEVSGNQYNEYRVHTKEDILKKLEPAKMDPSRRTECLAGTRTDVLNFIVDWVSDFSCTQNILWLYGFAGSGKSTICTTIANHFRETGQLGAFIFFDRDVTERSDPTLAVRTVAYQLGSFHPQIRELISASIDKTPAILLSPLSFQFQRLLVDIAPGLELLSTGSHIVLILDALDECGNAEDRETLVNLLSEKSADLHSTFRIIIASRPDVDIRHAFRSRSHILARELDLDSTITGHDISSYFRHHMALIRAKKSHLDTDWPGDAKICALTKRARGLFVWAATACRFINGHDPQKRLGIMMSTTSARAESALDALYQTALESAGSWDDEDFVSDFRSIMGVLLVLRSPLSSAAIDSLLGKPNGRSCIDTVLQLGCVVSSKPTVRVIHPSFADFLQTRSRCGREMWCFQKSAPNHALAIRCLCHLNQVLRRNVCNLTLSAKPEDQSLPEVVTYACVFWVDHICFIKGEVASIIEILEKFLYKHLLHWFEAMSILKRSRATIKLLDRLLTWIMNNSPNRKSLSDLVCDAHRFAQTFAQSIEDHPLLVYHSALPYAPITSTVYQNFHDVQSFPSVSGGFYQSWSPLLLVLAAHTSAVTSVAFSPDGARIASGSWDSTVRVWDSASGVEVLPALHGHEILVLSVTFSYDGTSIATGSGDMTVRVWDAKLGTELVSLRGHEGWVNSVAFSPDGTRIVSGSADQTIRVWDTIRSAEILPVRRGHRGSVESVAFSPDGTRIVSGSDDKTIRLWDPNSNTELLPALEGHDDLVLSVAFSRDGTRIVSGSRDRSIRIWDACSGVEVLTLQGHEDEVRSVTFSSDGARVVSGGCDRTIRVWDAQSGVELAVFCGHEDTVYSVATSPDGTRIVSGSRDKTTQIWDATSGAVGLSSISTRRGQKIRVQSVAFSPDGTRVVSGSVDKTIRVWDAASGAEMLPPLQGHQHAVKSVAFSPDGTRIVSGSLDKTVRIWDPKSGAEVLTALKGHEDGVWSVAFSHDGSRIVSGSEESVRVWDASSGTQLCFALTWYWRGVDCDSVAFSPDGTRVVSGASDGTVGVWDAKSGSEVLPRLPRQDRAVVTVTFSPDGTRILSRSGIDDWIVRVWDARSGNQLSDLNAADFIPNDPVLHSLSAAVVKKNGWIVNLLTKEIISKISPAIHPICSVGYRGSLAIGTSDGRVIVVHFPPTLYTSRETRSIEAGIPGAK